jgi:hypothetical protein
MMPLFTWNIREPAYEEQYGETYRKPGATPSQQSAAPDLFDTPRRRHPHRDVSNHFSFQTHPVGTCLEAREYLALRFPFQLRVYGTEV